jgi:hypothetical protein
MSSLGMVHAVGVAFWDGDAGLVQQSVEEADGASTVLRKEPGPATRRASAWPCSRRGRLQHDYPSRRRSSTEQKMPVASGPGTRSTKSRQGIGERLSQPNRHAASHLLPPDLGCSLGTAASEMSVPHVRIELLAR